MNEAQARQWIDRYADLILRISYSYFHTTCDGEDICQTVFLRYIRQEKPFRDAEHEKAWIIRTTVNICKDILKSAWRRTSVPLEEADFVETMPPDTEDLRRALGALPPKTRLAIYLHYYEGYTAKEIGGFLHKSDNAVRPGQQELIFQIITPEVISHIL